MAKFLKCEICGNIVLVLDDSGVTPECCGSEMTELTANTTDAATEKHVPVIERSGSALTVTVGSVPHPMTPEHHIEWIMVFQENRLLAAYLDPTKEAKDSFALPYADAPITVYEYCNLHGLWSAQG